MLSTVEEEALYKGEPTRVVLSQIAGCRKFGPPPPNSKQSASHWKAVLQAVRQERLILRLDIGIISTESVGLVRLTSGCTTVTAVSACEPSDQRQPRAASTWGETLDLLLAIAAGSYCSLARGGSHTGIALAQGCPSSLFSPLQASHNLLMEILQLVSRRFNIVGVPENGSRSRGRVPGLQLVGSVPRSYSAFPGG